MTDKELEFDQLVRNSTTRPTKGCKCLEAMLQGYRQRYYKDDGCMYHEERQEKEGEQE